MSRKWRIFSDREAETVLRRAVEIDSESSGLNLVDLKAVAAEVGVGADSVELAATEVMEAHESKSFTHRLPWRAMIAGASIGIIGGAWAVSAVTIKAFSPVSGLILTSVAAIPFIRGVARQRRFQINNLGVWAGFVLSQVPTLIVTVMTHPTLTVSVLGAIVEVSIQGLLFAAVVGGVVVMASGPRGASSWPGVRAISRRWKGALVARLKSLIDHLQRIVQVNGIGRMQTGLRM